ncbi:MAG TPA: hypothetical protein VHB70_08305 [Parafilimonas sp.]|nr:hypothetical protein [Parafilimonas sp.]
MYNIILILHSYLRWIILLLLFINLVKHFASLNKPFGNADKKLGLWLMIFTHITFLLGIYQWIAGAYGFHAIKNMGASAAMKDPVSRFFTVEHTVGMLIAIVLITIARGVFRKEISDRKKHRRCITLYLLALVIILAFIPWPGMEQVGRPLFRGL